MKYLEQTQPQVPLGEQAASDSGQKQKHEGEYREHALTPPPYYTLNFHSFSAH